MKRKARKKRTTKVRGTKAIDATPKPTVARLQKVIEALEQEKANLQSALVNKMIDTVERIPRLTGNAMIYHHREPGPALEGIPINRQEQAEAWQAIIQRQLLPQIAQLDEFEKRIVALEEWRKQQDPYDGHVD